VKFTIIALLAGLGLAIAPATALAQTAKASGQCSLYSQKAGRALYNGDCTIKQSVSGGSSTYEITMGTAEPYVFNSSDGRHWRYKGEKARFDNAVNSGAFYWGDFKLSIKQESAASIAGSNGSKLKAKEVAQCKLTNTTAGRQLYSGTCNVKQVVNGSSNKFTIQMGSGEPFMFATVDGVLWMHGPDKTRFEDLGHTAIFSWGDFRLEVREQ